MTRFPTARMSRRLSLGNAALAAVYFVAPLRGVAEAQQNGTVQLPGVMRHPERAVQARMAK